jgi:hypothetical protein
MINRLNTPYEQGIQELEEHNKIHITAKPIQIKRSHKTKTGEREKRKALTPQRKKYLQMDHIHILRTRSKSYVVTGAHSFCRGLWWHGRQCYGSGCYGWWVWVVPAVGLVEDVGWLDPVS